MTKHVTKRNVGRRDRKVDLDPPEATWLATGPDPGSDTGRFILLVRAKDRSDVLQKVHALLVSINREELFGLVEISYYHPNGSILYQNIEAR